MRINLDRVLARADQPWSGAEGGTRTPDLRTPFALLVSLRDMSIALRTEGNRLYVDITAGNVTRELLEALRQHQEVLLTILEWYEERAGLLEYDGGRWPRCQRRVAVLCSYDRLFLCRHCYRLPYASQCETALDRGYRKTRKIRTRLGVSYNMMERIGRKPKGMHWRTFQRLRDQEAEAHLAVLEGMGATLARLMRR